MKTIEEITNYYENKRKDLTKKKILFQKENNTFVPDSKVNQKDVQILILKNQYHLIWNIIFEKYSDNLSNEVLKNIILQSNNEEI